MNQPDCPSTQPWDAILDHCQGATRVVLAAPYIKAGALTKLLNEIGPGAQLECITRWSPQDIKAAVSDVSCRDIVVEYGGSFRLHNRLHAKFYKFDDQILVGSANLTASGLSYGHPGNFEILCEPKSTFDGQTFAEQLRKDSREVTDPEYLIWQQCPVDPIGNRDEAHEPSGSPLEDWQPMTHFPEYLWSLYTGQYDQIPLDEQRELALQDIKIIKIPQGLTEAEFHAWIEICLRASPFVDSIRLLMGLETETAWRALSEQWHVTMATASRSLSTVQNWLLYFERNP